MLLIMVVLLAGCGAHHTTPDNDADVDSGAAPDGGGDADTEVDPDADVPIDAAIADCLATYDWGCECHGECEDGFGHTVLYPETAGEFSSTISPSAELLEAGVAYYFCSVCEPCDEWHRIKPDDEWIDVSLREFCTFIVQYDEGCGGCLATSAGGAG